MTGIRLMVDLLFVEDNDVLTKPGVVRTSMTCWQRELAAIPSPSGNVALERVGRYRRVKITLLVLSRVLRVVSKSYLTALVPRQLAERRAVALSLSLCRPTMLLPVPLILAIWHAGRVRVLLTAA